MSNYNLTQKIITSLNNIDLDNTNRFYYTYNECDFFYKKKDNTDKLVISFHGNIEASVPVPVFRGYDYNFNMLCFYDMMCKENRKSGKICCSWFLSTTKNLYKSVYMEIIQYFIRPHLYKNVVFVASSSGCHASLFYGILFKKKVILMNAQFYIDRHELFSILLRDTGLKIEEFIDFQIEDIISKEGMPTNTTIVINRRDKPHYEKQYLPFKHFLNEKLLNDNVEFIEFDSDPADKFPAHWVRLPKTVELEDLIIKMFET